MIKVNQHRSTKKRKGVVSKKRVSRHKRRDIRQHLIYTN